MRNTTRHRVTVLCCLVLCVVGASSAVRGASPETQGEPPLEFQLTEFSMTLSRTFHENECSEYTVEVRGDGTGTSTCRRPPVFEARSADFPVSEGALSHLISTLHSGDFFELKPEYRGSRSVSVDSLGMVQLWGVISCPNPGRRSVFTVRIGEYTKRVAVFPGTHPCVLDYLERQIDDIVGQAHGEVSDAEGQ